MKRHLGAWAVVGLLMALGGWFAFAVWGAVLLLGSIGAAFVVAWRFGTAGGWIAMAAGGLALSGVLTWAAVTGARCPKPGEHMVIKPGKPAVVCADIRASNASMAVLFGVVGLMGIGWGIGSHRRQRVPQSTGSGTAPSALE